MTELKELGGIDDTMLAKLKEKGAEDGEGLLRLIETEGAGALAQSLGVSEEVVSSWKEDLSGDAEEAEEAEPEESVEASAEAVEAGAEDEGYHVKQKPVLDDATRRALKTREEIAARRPRFLRAEYYKAIRMGMKWRKPRGKQGKMRLFAYYRPKSVSAGYGSPASVRGLHPSGFAEKLVHNVSQLDGVDPKTTAVRIAHSVGTRKREAIVAEAEKLKIRVLNG